MAAWNWRLLAQDAGRHTTLWLDTTCANLPLPFEATMGNQNCSIAYCAQATTWPRSPKRATRGMEATNASRTIGFQLFGLRVAAYSSSQGSDPSEWQRCYSKALYSQSANGHHWSQKHRRGRTRLEEKRLASALRLCHEKATQGVCITCTRIHSL